MPRVRPRIVLLALATTLACSSNPSSSDPTEEPTSATTPTDDDLARLGLDPLIDRALAEPERAPEIAEQLRGRFGKPALTHLLARYRSELRGSAMAHEPAAWHALIDQVAQQRDARFGGLYWHRDLDQARAIAKTEGKPVLSLRLLGELTSEYSCANSRLFRTILYADPELASWIDRTFVLHWSSERPVPKVEIDFGDGRTMTRTLTGNSAHFVLDERGRTIDVIPGLWAPQQFRDALSESAALHDELAKVSEREWADWLALHHEQRFAEALARLGDELAWARGERPDPAGLRAILSDAPGDGLPVAAIRAVPMAVGKARIEAPILKAAPRELGGLAANAPSVGAPASLPDELERLMIGARLTGVVELHPNTRSIIAGERPLDPLVAADERERALAALERSLISSLQVDTAQNALELYPRVHAELARRARAGEPLGFGSVDAWLYAELFQTPASDPWLGLVDPTVYTGLIEGGLAVRRAKGS